jgi:adenine C2-methylase RlmN of 23S rRNA A2503 and tRNA A37
MAAGIPATVRMEKGAEIGAACGQLRAEAGAD